MILTLFGADTYRSKQKLGEIRAKFLRDIDPSGLNVTDLDASADVSELHTAVSAAPFLAKKRLVVLKNALTASKKKDKRDKEMVEAFSGIPEETILVVFEEADAEKLGKSAAFAQARDPKFYPEFTPLSSTKLSDWVVTEAKSRGFAFAPEALKTYLQYVTPDLWKTSGDLDKFAAHADGETVGVGDIHALADLNVEAGLFEFLDAIGTKRGGLAAKILEGLLDQGESEVGLMNRIQSHLRALLVSADKARFGAVSKDELARELGIHPYAASKALMQSRYFTLEELRTLYAWTIEADERLKSGGWSKPRLALDLLLLQIGKTPR